MAGPNSREQSVNGRTLFSLFLSVFWVLKGHLKPKCKWITSHWKTYWGACLVLCEVSASLAGSTLHSCFFHLEISFSSRTRFSHSSFHSVLKSLWHWGGRWEGEEEGRKGMSERERWRTGSLSCLLGTRLSSSGKSGIVRISNHTLLQFKKKSFTADIS